MSADEYRTWDAAYVLGALSADERAEYEEHLAGCAECRAAVGELAGVPGVLGRLDADTARDIAAEPSAPTMPSNDLVPRLSRRAGRARRLRRALLATGLAAGVAAGFVLGALLPHAGLPGGRSVDLASVDHAVVSAHLTASPAAWGTRLDWNCSYGDDATAAQYTGGRYELTVTTTDGSMHDVATWTAAGATSSGLTASVGVPLGSIRSVAIRTATGTVLANASV